MDRYVAAFAGEGDNDITICAADGVAYQTDMRAGRVSYGDDYWRKVTAYEDTDIAREVIRGRCAMVLRHVSAGASILDVGAGTGAFVRAARLAGLMANGDDVMPEALSRLRALGMHGDTPSMYDAVTLWDSIEHMETPEHVLCEVAPGAMVFASIPVFSDLRLVRESKHYRPGEHLYYWTAAGFIEWMRRHRFLFVEYSDHEMRAGRESIGAFAFRRLAA